MTAELDAAVDRLIQSCQKRRLSLAGAESCTGGLMAGAITRRPGVSSLFYGCIVSYANSAKSALLHVPASILEKEGAVSEACAAAMAKGAAEAFGTDAAWSITGVAGPTGGSVNKPVGYVCFGYYVNKTIRTESRQFDGNRDSIREQAVLHACLALSAILDSEVEQA